MATSTTTKKVLTIDDEEAIVELIVDILESSNYQAQSATKWTDAVDALNHNEPDLVLLDLKMPTIHGTSMLEFIRGEGFEMPVIVVSGFVTDHVTKELYAQGVQGVVKKPFEAKALLKEIERVLNEATPDATPAVESAPKSGMDALYDRAPESPPEPGKSAAPPPPAQSEPVASPAGPDEVNHLGGLEPADPFKQQRSRRGPPPMRSKSTRNNLVVMGGITVVCILVSGFLAIMQYLASEAPSYVEKIKSEANSTIRNQVNKQVQQAKQQQMMQQLPAKPPGK